MQAVDRGPPQLHPAAEVGGGQLPHRVQSGVRGEGVAPVVGGAEEGPLPEIGDPGQVGLQVRAREFGEEGPDPRVGEGGRVEAAQHDVEVGTA